MKRLMIALMALALGACAPSTGSGQAVGSAGSAPAPLAGTAIDEQAIVLAFELADAFASEVDRKVAAGEIAPGSARATKVKGALVALRTWLPVASAAQKAGNATRYAEAARHAATALREAAAALRGN